MSQAQLTKLRLSRLRQQRWLLFALLLALPVLLQVTVAIWMPSNYSAGLNRADFAAQYGSTVYRYRLLGSHLVLWCYDLVSRHFPERPFPIAHDPQRMFVFYATLMAVNACFQWLANAMLLKLMWRRNRGFRDAELSFYFFVTLLTVLSMAVVTPYDQLGYFLLLMGIAGARFNKLFVALGVVILSSFLGALNRETEFLLAPVLASLAFFSSGERRHHYRVLLGANVAATLAMYVGLRLLVRGNVTVVSAITWGGKWGMASGLLIVVILGTSMGLAARVYPDPRPFGVMLVLGLPYWIVITVGGMLRELRLTVPVVLMLFCLAVLLRRDAVGATPKHARGAL